MTIPMPLLVVLLTVLFGGLGSLVGIMLRVLGENTKAIEKINLYNERNEAEKKFINKERISTQNQTNRRFNEAFKKIGDHDIRLGNIERKVG